MQTIWITGGSSGIGFATAKEFINNNWQVVISSSNKIKLESAKKKLELNNNKNLVHAIVCDISSKNNVDETIAGTTKKITNGFVTPPVKYIKTANCITS